jgi:hypothetical protein
LILLRDTPVHSLSLCSCRTVGLHLCRRRCVFFFFTHLPSNTPCTQRLPLDRSPTRIPPPPQPPRLPPRSQHEQRRPLKQRFLPKTQISPLDILLYPHPAHSRLICYAQASLLAHLSRFPSSRRRSRLRPSPSLFQRAQLPPTFRREALRPFHTH